MKTLYAIPSYKCNLNCMHCHLKNKNSYEDFEKFIEELSRTDAERVILFGGEPLLDIEKFGMTLATKKITSISTNLTTEFNVLGLGNVLHEMNISIATSYNNFRFPTPELYQTWLNNMKLLRACHIPITVLITLTPDLVYTNPEDTGLHNRLKEMLMYANVTEFLFEPYIGEEECNEKADEWLCEFHELIKDIPIKNLLEDKLKNWNCNCDDVQTLEPSGILRKGCPDSLDLEKSVCNDCMACNLSYQCRPCALQKTCSYPKKYARKLGVIK